MASRASNTIDRQSAATITSRRGMSAKSRKEALQASRDMQPPPQDANENTKVPGENGMSQTKNLLTKRNKKPAYMQSLNEAEKAENFKIIDNMSKKITFLKNPRFKVNQAPILLTQAGQGAIQDKNNPFRIEPQTVSFVDYQVNGVYEIPVKVTNASSICRRIKFIPPTTENFTLKSVKYPSKVIGDIAPGMSVILYISFCAPSFADFDDFLTVVTEENSFKIPLKARRDPPVINLVNPLDCLHSWLGDRVDMAFRCVNSGGDGGFKFFCERDEDDSRQTDPDTIRIGSFTLSPAEFYLYSGNAIDIYVSFSPEKEGQLEENLILACDNQTSEFYKLTGYGAKLDLDIISVDNREVDFKANPFSTLFFENTNPTSQTSRKIQIKNTSPILVTYHWSIYKDKNTNKIILSNEETHYRIEPIQGKIQGGQTVEFTIFFSPDHAEPYYEFADLIVEDIPIQSVRNPPEGLRQFAEANNAVKTRIPMPTYVGSNTQFLSIPIIQFNLRGQGNSCAVSIDPPIAFFEGDCFINYQYTQTVKLKKEYEGVVKYKLRMEGKSSNAFSVDVRTQGYSLAANNGLIEGEIKTDKEIDLEISITSSECGEQMAYFYIEVADGAPLSFQCRANFRGPIVKVIEPVIDFSLIKVNTSQQYRICIENQGPVESEIIVKNSKNKRLTFQTLAQYERSDEIDGDPSVGISKTTNGNTIIIDNPSLKISPQSKIQVLLTLESIKPESVEEYFEVMVKDSESQFFQVLAEVQKPRVMLSRNIIDMGRIYAGVTEVIDYDHKQAIVLKNYGNIPANFQWEEIADGDRIIARFEPSRGTLPPKSEVQIYFSATVYTGGNINELFICNIDDLEIPLGFELHADSFGLNVSYETTDDTVQLPMQLTQASFKPMSQTQGTGFDQYPDQPFSVKSGSQLGQTVQGSVIGGQGGAMAKLQRELEGKQLRMLTFPTCKINKNTSQKFILKNLSGIKTSFKFSSLIFEPISHSAPQQKSEVQKAQEAFEAQQKALLNEEGTLTSSPSKQGSPLKSGQKQIRFAPSAKSGSRFGKTFQAQEQQKARNRAILSDEHEQTAKFSSATGETFTQTKKLEKEQGFFLSNNKGIAIVFNPQIGDLPPHSEVPITVTIYNNVCGKFDDKIVSEIKGLPPIEFPISIGISGSPIVVPPNQVGLNYKTTPPTLPMPTIVTNSQPIQKQFKIKNTGIRSVQVDWKIFDEKDLKSKDTDYFNLSVAKNFSYDRKENPYKFNFEAIEPQESQDSAFEISPKQLVVGPREITTFTVTFYSNKGEGEFKSVILATPELSQEELSIAEDGDEFSRKGSLGIISLNLYAVTIKPKLIIDKKSRYDGENHLNFKYWSIPNDENAPNAVQKFTYTNDSKADLTFNLQLSGPFEIVATKSNTGAKHPLASSQPPSKRQLFFKQQNQFIVIKQKPETLFCLQPLKIVEISVKFLAPSPSNNEEWPMIMKNDRKGEIMAYFANGDSQKLVLDGFLLRPKLDLLTEKPSKNDKAMDELDFGTVNVDKFRTIKVFLTNVTEPTARWKLNYVSFPKKSTIGYSTTTPWEQENMNKTDDADVFEFSTTEGVLKGKSLPLRKAPEGICAAPVPKDDFEKELMPQTILINFRPKQNVLYKSKFRFTVENGISCDVILKGQGSYEEQHD